MSTGTSATSSASTSRSSSPEPEDTEILTTQLEALTIDSIMSSSNASPRPSNSSVTNLSLGTQNNGSLKAKEPETFGGEPGKYRDFMMQARAYLKFTDWAVDKQVLYLTSCLRGGPAKWIEPHLEDYLDNPRSADWKPKTRELFHSLSNF